jgi:hypothetical protein
MRGRRNGADRRGPDLRSCNRPQTRDRDDPRVGPPAVDLEPESRRILIEALMSACPIVGHDRPHRSELVSIRGGGLLCPLGDWRPGDGALAARTTDQAWLVELIRRASRDSGRCNSDIVSRGRCALIRKRLGWSLQKPTARTHMDQRQ